MHGWLLALCLAGGLFGRAQEPSVSPEDVAAFFDRARHAPRGPELAVDELVMDPEARPRRRVTAAEAAEDVERFFQLLEHSYCGYGFFSQEHDFDAARESLLRELRERESWPTGELAGRIRRHLGFVHDCHLKLGDVQFAGHQDFWFAPGVELVARDGGPT